MQLLCNFGHVNLLIDELSLIYLEDQKSFVEAFSELLNSLLDIEALDIEALDMEALEDAQCLRCCQRQEQTELVRAYTHLSWWP